MRRFFLVVFIAAMLWCGAIWFGRSVLATTGIDAAGQCIGDANRDGAVTVDEVYGAINNALDDCSLMPITLQFSGNVGEQTFTCGSIYHGVGTTGADIVPSDFRFYVHNVRLIRDDGVEVSVLLDQDGIWQYQNVALLDFEDKTQPCNNCTKQMNATVRGKIAPGTYNGVRFTLGVPFRLNHADQSVAPPPLNLTGLFWSWQDGYKFIRIDTAFDNLRVHVGSTGCYYVRPNVIGGCAHPNRGEIYLPAFNPANDTIVADLAVLLSDSDINSNQPDTPPGCMADPNDSDCDPIMRNLGVDFANGLPAAGPQKFFRVVSPTPVP
ncbi:MAG: metallo-mystery pair system four-Cys motif protein [Deltaproteobacteria bacterium]|nr:metallo-mystery pair system four-Cys motif protein [Deltaproteobacteria bacterium]